MKIADAEKLALSLMEDYELIGEYTGYDPRMYKPMQWTFGFDNCRNRLGSCRIDEYKITLSRAMVELNDEKVVRDIILHEIAHALVERRLGAECADGANEWHLRNDKRWAAHGSEFKDTAVWLGVKPRSTCSVDGLVVPSSQWLGTCPSCGDESLTHRRTRSSCAKCSGSV
jgi:predicted SprT family Zn-dependent metalloprotease